MTHTIPDYRLRQRAIRVVVIGCGGNGSVIAMGLPYIHQALLLAGHPGGLDVILIDGDLVSPSNCVRQPFSMSEVGLSKSVVLASRINLFWGLSWKAVPENVGQGQGVSDADLVISCVDTRAARSSIEKLVTGVAGVSYWLDLGNGAEGGQFVLGQPWNRRNPRRASRLRTASELFPEIVDTSLPDDDAPSCSAAVALQRQEPFVNQTVASHALALLAHLFRHRELQAHGAFVGVTSHEVRPISVDKGLWKRIRARGRSRRRSEPAQSVYS